MDPDLAGFPGDSKIVQCLVEDGSSGNDCGHLFDPRAPTSNAPVWAFKLLLVSSVDIDRGYNSRVGRSHFLT